MTEPPPRPDAPPEVVLRVARQRQSAIPDRDSAGPMARHLTASEPFFSVKAPARRRVARRWFAVRLSSSESYRNLVPAR